METYTFYPTPKACALTDILDVWLYSQVDQLIPLDYNKISEALHTGMEYLELVPCSKEFLESLTTGKEQINRQKTVFQFVFGQGQALVGTLRSYFIEIYDMNEPPSAAILSTGLPLGNSQLGIRCDADILSEPWRDNMKRFRDLVHLRMDARPGMLDALTGAKPLFMYFMTKVNEVTMAFTEKDVAHKNAKDYPTKEKQMQTDVAAFLATLDMQLNVIFSGRNQYDLSKLCETKGPQLIDRVYQTTYVCLP